MGLLKEGFHNLAVEIARWFAAGLLEDEVEQLCGGRYVRGPEKRVARRHGGQRGWAMVAGQKVRWNVPGSAIQWRRSALKVYGLLQNLTPRGRCYGESYMACRRGTTSRW